VAERLRPGAQGLEPHDDIAAAPLRRQHIEDSPVLGLPPDGGS
jgi:hypothetical protein